MANRIGTINQFENLSPPWLLTSLDQYFAFITSGFTDSSLGWVNGVPLDTGTANNYVISALRVGVPSNYQDGMMLVWIPITPIPARATSRSTLWVAPRFLTLPGSYCKVANSPLTRPLRWSTNRPPLPGSGSLVRVPWESKRC